MTVTRGERIRKGSRNRREQEKEELRQTILRAAGELFVREGYDHFSMRRLAEEIGYSVATLYLYFRDKDDLLFTVVDEGFARFTRLLAQAAESSEEPWERLTALSEAYISFGLQNPGYYQLMFMWRSDFLAQARSGEDEPRFKAFGVLREAVEYAMEAGVVEVGDVESYSDVLWVVMHGIVAMAITIPAFEGERLQKLINLARVTIYKAFHGM
jgi:AcrR family transcriptional regulator